MSVAVFVMDGHDIELYADADAAALEVEGYDVPIYDFLGVDGTVYEATLVGPEWGPVRLRRTQQNRLEDLIHMLFAEADYRGLRLPPETPDAPEAIWAAILAAEEARRPPRRRWWQRGAR